MKSSSHEFRVERPIRHAKGVPDGRVPALRQLLAGEPNPRRQFTWLWALVRRLA